MAKRNTQASNSHTAANTHAQITRKETKKSFREFKWCWIYFLICLCKDLHFNRKEWYFYQIVYQM